MSERFANAGNATKGMNSGLRQHMNGQKKEFSESAGKELASQVTSRLHPLFVTAATKELRTGRVAADIIFLALSKAGGDERTAAPEYVKLRAAQMEKEFDLTVRARRVELSFIVACCAMTAVAMIVMIVAALPQLSALNMGGGYILVVILVCYALLLFNRLSDSTPSLSVSVAGIHIETLSKKVFELHEITKVRIERRFNIYRVLVFSLKDARSISLSSIWSSMPLEQLEQEINKRMVQVA